MTPDNDTVIIWSPIQAHPSCISGTAVPNVKSLSKMSVKVRNVTKIEKCQKISIGKFVEKLCIDL